MTADDLCKVMEAMRTHGVARVQVGETQLELGAQAPSVVLAQAFELARGHLVDEQRQRAQVHGPAEREAVALEAELEAMEGPAIPADEHDAHAPPRRPPTAKPAAGRDALLALDKDDPLLYQLSKGEGVGG